MTQLRIAELASACYSLTGTDREWLEGVTRVVNPLMDGGWGVHAWPFSLGCWVPEEQAVGVDPEFGRLLYQVGAAIPEDLAARFHLGPRTQTASERVNKPGGLFDVPGFEPLLALGVVDFRALTVLDTSGQGLMFASAQPKAVKSERAASKRLERVAAHVLSGFRLRRALTEVDAVLEPDGKLLDASDEAEAPAHREALRTAVKALDRAWSKKGTGDPDAALEGWQALIAGRWSLVESFESDGRRFLLARRNPPGTPPRVALTPLEAHALLRRAQAASYKLVAYELGLSASSVHQHVRRAMQKLGIDNEAELPLLLRPA